MRSSQIFRKLLEERIGYVQKSAEFKESRDYGFCHRERKIQRISIGLYIHAIEAIAYNSDKLAFGENAPFKQPDCARRAFASSLGIKRLYSVSIIA